MPESGVAPRKEARRFGVRRFVGGRALRDAAILVLIFVGGEQGGSRFVIAFERVAHAEFGQAQFGAAVALSCGRGFVDPTPPSPALAGFLSRSVDAFSCDQLPPARLASPPNFTQALYRYLMTAVALRWRWAGITWSGLAPVCGVAFALTLCAAYGLFRLAAGPLLSLAGVVPLALSAHHLEHLPSLRDYAKAPFILLLILLMGHLAIPPVSRGRSLWLAAAFGLVLGVGFGFRNDLLINVPPYLVVVLCLMTGRVRDQLRLKLVCLALTTTMFVISAWPILAAYRSGSNTGHVAVLGFMSGFDRALGLTRPVYELGPHYLDGYAAVAIEAHSRLHTGHLVDYLSHDYDRAAAALLVDLARHWPADLVARAYSAALQVLEFPFTVGLYGDAVPRGITAPLLLRVYEWQRVALRMFTGMGLVLVGLSVAIIGARNLRAALAIVVLLIYYCGYPAIQFDIRHFFHLEFIVWWAMVFLVASAAGAYLSALADPSTLWGDLIRRMRSGAIALLAAAVIIAVPLWLARAYQQRHLVTLFDLYLQAHRAPSTLVRTVAGAVTHVGVDGLWSETDAADLVSVRYLVAEFSAEGCGVRNLPVLVKYDAISPPNDFSALARVTIPPSGRTLRFVPAYKSSNLLQFASFDIAERDAACLKSVSVVDDLTRIPVLMGLDLAPSWRDSPLFQQIITMDNTPVPDAIAITMPENLAVPLDSRLTRLQPPQFDHLAEGVVRRGPHGFAGRVTTWISQQELVHSIAQALPAGSVLKVDGVLRRGALQVGITTNDRWSAAHTVTQAGPFTVVIQVPAEGLYGILVGNYSASRWRMERQSVLRRAVKLMCPVLHDDFELHDVAWVTQLNGAEDH